MLQNEPAASSPRLPQGVVVQPRKFRFDDVEAIPQYWFGGNPLITHIENTFSLLIPPGERFFIRSVKHYADRVADDADMQALIRAFAHQEGLHTGAHNEFNRAIGNHGIDIDREIAEAERAIRRLERLPHRMQLGVTVFLEHLTACGAHTMFTRPDVAAMMAPQARRFWRWHAAEELEHKAVAFDLLRIVGGGYVTRVVSALAALVLIAPHFVRTVKRMVREDGVGKITPEVRREARALHRRIFPQQLRMVLAYFKPGFHPWKTDDRPLLRAWYDEREDAPQAATP